MSKSDSHEVNIQTVAQAAGVSPATVSRVLNGSARVSSEKIEAVRQAIRHFGYKANPFARSLLAGSLQAVGVLVPNLKDEFYGALVTSIERQLRAHGLHMMCSLGHDDAAEEERALEIFRERELDGLILLADHLPDAALLDLASRKVPVVLMNRSLPELARHCVRLNNALGGYLATKHLIDLGHTRIAHVTGPLNRLDTRERLDGYRKALREAKLPYDEALAVSIQGVEWGREAGRDATLRLLARTSFSALFAENDWLAIGALQALREKERNVPEDVSVVSFDNRSVAEVTAPSLTTIDFPKVEMGQRAADHLIALVRGEEPESLPILQPHLVVRDSTTACSGYR